MLCNELYKVGSLVSRRALLKHVQCIWHFHMQTPSIPSTTPLSDNPAFHPYARSSLLGSCGAIPPCHQKRNSQMQTPADSGPKPSAPSLDALGFHRKEMKKPYTNTSSKNTPGPGTHPWGDAAHGWQGTRRNLEHLQPSRGPPMPCWRTGCRLFHRPPSPPLTQPCLWSRWNRSFDLLLLWSHLHPSGRHPAGAARDPMATTSGRRSTQRWPLHFSWPACPGRCQASGFGHLPQPLWQWRERRLTSFETFDEWCVHLPMHAEDEHPKKLLCNPEDVLIFPILSDA